MQPGPIDTEMHPADGDFAEVQRTTMALGRYSRPAAVALPASQEASSSTGATLDVDGDGFGD